MSLVAKMPTSVVTTATPRLLPTSSEVWFRAAAVLGSRRGTLAKMIAVRTVVAMTKPAPMARNGTMKYRYGVVGD